MNTRIPKAIGLIALVLPALAACDRMTADNANLASPFAMHTAENDSTVATTIPIGDKTRLMLMGDRADNGDVTIRSITYSHDGNVVLSHEDQTMDGTLDELELRLPPFEEIRLFTRQDDGSYAPAPEERRRVVEETHRIYDEVFDRVFSGDLSKEEADKAVEDAHRRVRELNGNSAE